MGTDSSVRVVRNGTLEASSISLEQISEELSTADDAEVLWVDLCQPSAETLTRLADSLGVHQLAIDDALGPHQRPKLDRFATHMFLACHAVTLNPDTATIKVCEVDTIIGDRWVITVRKESDFSMEPVVQRFNGTVDHNHGGVALIVYSLIDTILEGYFGVVEDFEEYYDDVANEIFDEKPLQPDEQRKWFFMRQALIRFHRLAFPLREAVGSMIRDSGELVSDEIRPYYQDLYDHVLRITESTESLRDLVSTIVETNLSLRDYRQNQVMKKVTSWAGIIAVPTLVTGFYGMNVEFPSIGSPVGAFVAIILMVTTSLLLYVQFRRRDWL